MFTNDDREYSVLQILDVSTRVRYQKLSEENVQLQTINATVSHEMRNPLNAIMSQNLKMKEMVRLIKKLLQDN